jgi:hypothetical protein
MVKYFVGQGRVGITAFAVMQCLCAATVEAQSLPVELPLSAISTEATQAGGPYASANRDHPTTIAKIWDQNPYGVMQTYTDDYGNPRVTNASAAHASLQPVVPNTVRDNPKVFGRSARGG